MDNFTDGDFTVADYALLQDSPFEDDCVFAPEYKTDDYVRVTQLYCDGVGMKYKDYAQSEKHLEFDICNIRCSKPLSVLQDYCDAIKIYIFWPLLFQYQYSSVISRLHPCVETISRASEMSLKKLQYLELM
ncbi:E3 ubiquitin-protein ligase TTC3-like [Urocitellus parryii]